MSGGPPSPEHTEASEDWLMSYADFVTVLMGLFLILFALSDPNPGRFEEVSKGFIENQTAKKVETPFKDLNKNLNAVVVEGGGQAANTATEQRGQVVPFAGDRMFGPGSADILPAAEPLLDRIAQLLTLSFARTNYKVVVEGHTDDVPINSAKFPSNWELSSARASAVVRFLIGRGVQPDRLSAVGLAETQPVVPNLDKNGNPLPDNRSKNRRVVIKIER